MNRIFFLQYVFLFYFWLKLSNTHGCVLSFWFIRIWYYVLWDSPSFIRVIICGFKRIFQIKKGFTLVCSTHLKPEDMYKTITGLTRLKHRNFHGPRRVKTANKTNFKSKKKFADQQAEEKRPQFFVNSIQFNSHKNLLAESSIKRKSRSLINMTTRLLPRNPALHRASVAAIRFDLN